MKCPNCGKDIPAGKLYCESCGTEIVIVDEDIDLELQMKNTMSDIVSKEFGEKESNKKISEKARTETPKKMSDSKEKIKKISAQKLSRAEKEKKKYDEMEFDDDDNPSIIGMIFKRGSKTGWMFYVVIGIVICVVLFVAIKMARNVTYQNSLGYQIEMAEQAANESNYDLAIRYLEKAAKIAPSNATYNFTIAEYYQKLDKFDDSVYTLTAIAEGTDYDLSSRVKAYNDVISLLKERNAYSKIGDLLQNCDILTIKDQYAGYLVSAPIFSIEGGTYTEQVVLILQTEGNSNIYYTVDGSDPISDGVLYTGPLTLEYGSYIVKAVSVNDYEIPSEIVMNKYLIDVSFTFSADVSPESGEYEHAFFIEVNVPLMYTCYYTTDGDDPDKTSKKYTAKIPVSAGESTYKFIVYASDGTPSEIVEKNYNVVINTELDPASAVTILNDNLIARGYLDESGAHREGIEGTYLFMYSTVYYIEGMGDFYIVVEYLQDTYGNNKKTGMIYAIDCYNATLYTVSDEAGTYVLTAMN